MSHQLPGQQSEGLLVIKQISQPNLIVHDCLQTLYTFQLDSVPLGVTENYHLIELESTFGPDDSLSEALVENIEDLLQPLVAEVLDPVETVVGEGHSQRFYTVQFLGERQLRV